MSGPTRQGRGAQTRRSEVYDEFQHQWIEHRARVNAAHDIREEENDGDFEEGDLALNTNFTGFKVKMEPAGGLSRDEVAELVAIRGHVKAGLHYWWGEPQWPMFFDIRRFMQMKPDRVGAGQIDIDEPEPDHLARIGGDSDAPSVLDEERFRVDTGQWVTADSRIGGTTDEEASTVSPSGYDREHLEINFRDLYDQGPVFDRHDDIWFVTGGRVIIPTVDGENPYSDNNNRVPAANLYENLQFIWDVSLEN